MAARASLLRVSSELRAASCSLLTGGTCLQCPLSSSVSSQLASTSAAGSTSSSSTFYTGAAAASAQPAYVTDDLPPEPAQPGVGTATATADPLGGGSSASSASNPREPFQPLDFNDTATAFEKRSTTDLLRAWLVFTGCTIRPAVNRADTILAWSRRLLGTTLTDAAMRYTFFKHFCAGESHGQLKPTLDMLQVQGVGSILDYAAEDDVHDEDGPASRSQPVDSVVARTYSYATEQKCDHHRDTFLSCIEAAARAPGQGFAAIKVTALGNPRLLERISASLKAVEGLFSVFDLDQDNFITFDEFEKVYAELFDDASPQRIISLFDAVNPKGSDQICPLSWSRHVDIRQVPALAAHCRSPGPVSKSSLTGEEIKLLDSMMARLNACAEAASAGNVRLMIDAEHSYFQPAINYAAVQLQRDHNKRAPVIFNTYQAYLKDCRQRLLLDMMRAREEGWRFGCKMVRGAYMQLERERAADKGYPSPILDTIEDTHANYNRCIEDCLAEVANAGAEVMVATHNTHSIEQTVAQMHATGLPKSAGVYFGQLLGMADPLTFLLGRHGYRAYKYVPYGKVSEVMPYLIRRAQENSSVLGGVVKERQLVGREVVRRLFSRRR